jgi:membrane associated rhomboid family serine protease
MLYRGLAEADLSGEGIVRLIQGGTVVKVHLDRQATNISLPVAFYLLCGLAAALGQILADPSSAIPMVGASGAISGVMGGYLLLYPNVRVFAILPLGFFVTSIALPASSDSCT